MHESDFARMRTLIVGVGALGGVIAGRLRVSGAQVSLATRDPASAALLRASGLLVTGIGGSLSVGMPDVAGIDEYSTRGSFDLVVLATKARDAISAAPRVAQLLGEAGTLLPIQNGTVSQILADQLGGERVLGGLSNLGATMTEPGQYEQRNHGHILIGELAGGESARVERVRRWLGRGVEVRVTTNLRGAAWSKLLLNCAVTTIGAVAGCAMRNYVSLPEGRDLFDRAYDEALSVALASGARPERMLVDPVPPGWNGRSVPSDAHEAWLAEVLKAYGDLKPSMLQDFERHRTTEVDFINGYVVSLGQRLNVATPANVAIGEAVHAISLGELAPDRTLLRRISSRLGTAR